MHDRKQNACNLQDFIIINQLQKTISTPISYSYYPVDIISKEFTKLNSHYHYKIHYLGPRPLSIDQLHKKYGRNAKNWHLQPMQERQQELGESLQMAELGRYRVDMKKIINCNVLSEKIYEIDHSKQIFYRAFEGMNPSLTKTEQYVFDSAFQSGNLDCAIKIQPNEFDLFLRIDSNSRGHMAWYYFSVKNHHKLETVTFNICALRKPSRLYESGMKPYVFSKKQWMINKKGWGQNCNECCFAQKPLRFSFVYDKCSIEERYTLTFSYQFIHADDEVFFAYCIPFTYSELQHNIQKYQTSEHVQVNMLGKSLSGVDIPIINISNHDVDPRKKKSIIITARVHPGQSNSSHTLNGIIDFLLSNQRVAFQLRNNCNFFIVPMLNPDGVILGNNRTSLSGKDLNRTFDRNNKELFPQIYYLKAFLQKLRKKYKILMYLDFHGHSKKKSTFAYGPNYPITHSEFERVRFFPKLIEKFNNKFRFYGSSFILTEDKLSTARAIMLYDYKIIYVYTIQSSIGLYHDPSLLKTLPFNKFIMHEMGISVINALHTFVLLLNYQEELFLQRRQEKMRLRQKIEQSKSMQFGKNNQEVNELKSLEIQLYQEIRKQSDVNFDKELSSDDHNQSEDMELKKQEELGNFYKKTHKKNNWSDKRQNLQDIKQRSSSSYINNQFQETSPKKLYYQSSITQQGRKTATAGQSKRTTISSRKQQRNILTNEHSKQLSPEGYGYGIAYGMIPRISTSVQTSRNGQFLQKQKAKSILRQNNKRQKYNLATTNLLPDTNVCQPEILPINIKNMRSQMKKGRTLLRFFQMSKKKYDHEKIHLNFNELKEDKTLLLISPKTQSIKSRIYLKKHSSPQPKRHCLPQSKRNDSPDDHLSFRTRQKNAGISNLSARDKQQNSICNGVMTFTKLKLP